MAKKKPTAAVRPPADALAPNLDPDLAALYFNHNATIEQRVLIVGLQQLRILRELQAAGRAATLELAITAEPKRMDLVEKKRKPRTP